MVTVPVASPPLDEVTTALLDLFDLSGRTRTGRQGFDAVFDGNAIKPLYPYWILYQIPGGSSDPMPDLDKRGDEVTAAWQLTAASNYRNQAQQLRRTCRDLLLARSPSGAWLYPITVPDGWAITDRSADAVSPGVERTGDPPNAIFTAPQPFTLTLVPA